MSYRRLFTQKLPLCQGVFICFVLLFKEFWLTFVLNKECVFKLNIFFFEDIFYFLSLSSVLSLVSNEFSLESRNYFWKTSDLQFRFFFFF